MQSGIGKKKSESIPKLTFFPTNSIDPGEDEPWFSKDEDEESHPKSQQLTSAAPSNSEQSRPTKFKSLNQLYEERSPISPNLEDFMVFAEQPMTYTEDSREEAWRVAMMEEVQIIDRSQTWKLVTPQLGCRAIGLKWIFKLKRNTLGKVVRHKAKLVVKGYSQKQGIDYQEVFAPMI